MASTAFMTGGLHPKETFRSMVRRSNEAAGSLEGSIRPLEDGLHPAVIRRKEPIRIRLRADDFDLGQAKRFRRVVHEDIIQTRGRLRNGHRKALSLRVERRPGIEESRAARWRQAPHRRRIRLRIEVP